MTYIEVSMCYARNSLKLLRDVSHGFINQINKTDLYTFY